MVWISQSAGAMVSMVVGSPRHRHDSRSAAGPRPATCDLADRGGLAAGHEICYNERSVGLPGCAADVAVRGAPPLCYYVGNLGSPGTVRASRR